MSKSRDIADSAATINFIDTVTSNVQDQIDNLDPLPSQTGNTGKFLTTNGTVPNWVTLTTDPTLGTLTKTFTNGESASISLTSSVLAPVVSVIKEVPQTGVTNNNWDVSSTTENYTRLDSAPATTLSFEATGYTIETAVLNYSYAILYAQEPSVEDIKFNTDGTKMFIVGESGDKVNEYDLSTAFDISTLSFSRDFSVASQDTRPSGLFFNANGTKMFVVGLQGDKVYEYSLSTGFNISTALYTQFFSISAQEVNPTGLAFNTDGTTMFVVGSSGDKVYEYSLSTGFDISTASFVDSFSTSGQTAVPKGIAFTPDGTKMFIASDQAQDVFMYNLTTGFDVSTASYSGTSFGLSNAFQTTGITFNNDGSKMYITDSFNDKIHEYNLTLANALGLGAGSFASADVGKTIEANSGVFVLTATDGSYVETTAPTSYAQVASGSWEMYGVVYNAADGDLELSSYSDVYNLATASYDSKSFNVGGQAANPYGMCFNSAGTKLYVMQYFGIVYQYTLSTAWDVSTASYDSVSYNTTSQTSAASDIKLNNTGTKMYVLAENNRTLWQYSLSTPEAVNTASYDSVSISLSSLDTAPEGFVFSSDGTKMYFVGITTDSVYRYDLTTAFDLSTASYTSQSLSVAAKDTRPNGVAISADGAALFVAGDSSNAVHEYAMSTAYNLSTASFVRTFSVAAQSAEVESVVFGSGGAKMYIVGTGTDTVYQYSTGAGVIPASGYHPVHTTSSIDSTYWTDINSMTADQAAGDGNVYYAISTDDRTTWTVIDNTDGERDIVRNNAGTWQYNSNGTYASETWVNGATNTELATLAEAMEGATGGTGPITNWSYQSKSFSVASQETTPTGITFNSDATKMYVCGEGTDSIYQYTLSTAGDVSTASYDSVSFSVASQTDAPRSIVFNNDGTSLYVCSGSPSSRAYQYTLSTAYDLSTASYASKTFLLSSQELYPNGLVFNADGTSMYIVGQGTDTIYQYTLSTGFDVSTASYASKSFSVSSLDTSPTGIEFNSDGTKIYVVGETSDKIHAISLSTAYDISTASSDGESLDISGQGGTPRDVSFGNNYQNIYTIDSGNDTAFQYFASGYINQMDKTQLDAVTDPNHIALGDDLDLAIVFNMTSGSTVPSSDGVAINYDATVLNKGAVLGTDYDFDTPTQNSVRITALAGNNLKVRVV